jgi:hypothetical protein
MDRTHEQSSTKYIAITGLKLNVFRMKNTGIYEIIGGYDDLYGTSNKAIYTCCTCQDCCVLEAIFIARKPDVYKKLKGEPKKTLARMHEQYLDLFGTKIPKNLFLNTTEVSKSKQTESGHLRIRGWIGTAQSSSLISGRNLPSHLSTWALNRSGWCLKDDLVMRYVLHL